VASLLLGRIVVGVRELLRYWDVNFAYAGIFRVWAEKLTAIVADDIARWRYGLYLK
jgi:hypothetical protein